MSDSGNTGQDSDRTPVLQFWGPGGQGPDPSVPEPLGRV